MSLHWEKHASGAAQVKCVNCSESTDVQKYYKLLLNGQQSKAATFQNKSKCIVSVQPMKLYENFYGIFSQLSLKFVSRGENCMMELKWNDRRSSPILLFKFPISLHFMLFPDYGAHNLRITRRGWSWMVSKKKKRSALSD